MSGVSPRVAIPERLTLTAPLGVRFVDATFGALVGGGLAVTAYPPDNPARRVPAVMNRSGVHALRGLPGLREAEFGAGDAAYWATTPSRPFVVEVEDGERRYQPCRFRADLPTRGLFRWECAPLASPLAGLAESPAAVAAVPLFSAPTRRAPGATAILRAELWDAVAEVPASWAVLDAYPDERPGQPPVRGVADAQGRVLLLFPYPEPLPGPIGSPLGSPPQPGSLPLREQEWPVRLEAFYAPPGPHAPVPPVLDLDGLCDVLARPPATLWADRARTQPLPPVTLRFGQACVVRSIDETAQEPLSVLLLTPSGSPL